MTWQITLPAVLSWTSAFITVFVAWLTWSRRSIPGVRALFWMLVVVAEWSLLAGLEAAAVPLATKILLSKIEYLGSTNAAPLFLLFCLSYTRQTRWITKRNLLILWSVPILAILLVWTNEWHSLIWTAFTPSPQAGSNLYVYHHGVGFFVLIAYVYICNVVATVLLLRTYFHTASIYRRQIIIVVGGGFIPWIGSLIYAFNLVPIAGLDITPIFFACTCLVLAWGIVEYQLFDLVPVARDLLIESLQEGILVLDPRNRIVDMNQAALQLLGLSAIPAGVEISSFQSKWPVLITTLMEKPELAAEIQLSPEADLFLEIRTTSILGAKNQLIGNLITLGDITDRKRIEYKLEAQARELERLAVTDDLTGMYNRRHTNEVMRREFQRSERSGRPFAIALFDLDNLKRINDNYGHACGDAVLKAIADEMTRNFRSSDLTARMGGDEFLVIFFDTNVDKAWYSMERLRLRLAALEMNEFGGETGHVTISGGVTGWFAGDTPEAALKRVDRLLYQAKAKGKDRIIKGRK
jgi:diguanylate cyclase (GGDEF)-like protein